LNPGIFVGTVFAGAFAFGIGFDVGVTKFYDSWNRGVRRRGVSSHFMISDTAIFPETMEGYPS